MNNLLFKTVILKTDDHRRLVKPQEIGKKSGERPVLLPFPHFNNC